MRSLKLTAAISPTVCASWPSALCGGRNRVFPQPTRGPVLLRRLLEQNPGRVALPDGLANLMTIHLFSSCPMGEDKSKCATDSFGQVHGFKNLFINDASLLCTAPGVNPQAPIMAIARRNLAVLAQTQRG